MINGGSGTSQTGNYQAKPKYICERFESFDQYRKFTVTRCVKCLHFHCFPLYRFGYGIEIYLLYADELNQSNI